MIKRITDENIIDKRCLKKLLWKKNTSYLMSYGNKYDFANSI